jgi:hypothetical protein
LRSDIAGIPHPRKHQPKNPLEPHQAIAGYCCHIPSRGTAQRSPCASLEAQKGRVSPLGGTQNRPRLSRLNVLDSLLITLHGKWSSPHHAGRCCAMSAPAGRG